ncbi:MAG TPA: ABC transporter substrate-binding protein [Pseudonocardia sp.]|uniref:ABC transporter substrate-binding protein n=1 Tax=Pseudonocardia sp. TaxID=60912 RepID=UPI002B4ADE04|nr:ABC transporter substrate-binding protein [Pseudonocardia sp.]HLU60545.1 ABC transporter substrate-binding protein [Pseudonocardia sp.]
MPLLLAPDEPGLDALRSELTRRTLITSAGLAALLTACGGAPEPALEPGRTRTVVHALGTAEVPVAPQRVVSLDSNGALQVGLELGAPLVASETLDGAVSVPPYVPAPPPGFEPLGFNQLDLERVAALRPDLIIGNVPRVEPAYPELSRIAPTVAYRNAGAGQDWRESVRAIGDVLGALPRVEEGLARYAARVADVAARHADLIAGATVALLRFTSSELRIVRGEIFGASILAHAGIRRPPSTDTPGPSATYVSLTDETVGVTADADVLLYFVGGGGSAVDAAATAQRYTSGELWQQLPAVRAGRVVELDPVAWWDGYSVSAAMACLDELDAALARL